MFEPPLKQGAVKPTSDELGEEAGVVMELAVFAVRLVDVELSVEQVKEGKKAVHEWKNCDKGRSGA